MSEIEWAAGLFEGEGSIERWRPTGQGNQQARLAVSMTDRDVLERFAKIVGVGKVWGPYQTKSGLNAKGQPYKPMYRWAVVRITDVQRILRDFWPYLGQRRRARAADVIAGYYESPRRPPGNPRLIGNRS